MSETVSTGAQLYGEQSNGNLLPIKLNSNGSIINTSDSVDLGIIISSSIIGAPGYAIPAGATVYSDHIKGYGWARSASYMFLSPTTYTTSNYKYMVKKYFSGGVSAESEYTAISITANAWALYNFTNWWTDDIQFGIKNSTASTMTMAMKVYIYA